MSDRKITEPVQLEFDFGVPVEQPPPPVSLGGAAPIIAELEQAIRYHSYGGCVRALRKFTDYVWKCFYKASN